MQKTKEKRYEWGKNRSKGHNRDHDKQTVKKRKFKTKTQKEQIKGRETEETVRKE